MKTAPLHSHFVGVTVSGSLAETVANCRRWMHERYGCKSGHKTPPHVTLVPPFLLPEDLPVREFERILGIFASRAKPFTSHVTGFGAFAERTIFAHVVPDAAWDQWHSLMYELLAKSGKGSFPDEKKRFVPHVTVSNRDIPIGAVPEALTHFNSLCLDTEIRVDHIALFERVDSRWDIRNGWYCE